MTKLTDTTFLKAMTEYLNNGGTTARIRQWCDQRDAKMGEGHFESARKGPRFIANPHQPNGDAVGQMNRAEGLLSRARPSPANEQEGHTEDADKAAFCLPSTDRGGKGHSQYAKKGQASVAQPAREPSISARKAAVKVAKASANNLLKLYGRLGEARMPAGPCYRDVRVGEVAKFRKRQVKEGANHGRAAVILARIDHELKKMGQADHDAMVFDVLPAKIIREISEQTEMDVIGPMAAGWLEGFIQQSEKLITGAQNNA